MEIETYKRNVYEGIDLALSARDYKLHEAVGEIVDNTIANPFLDETGKPEKVKVEIHVGDDVIFFKDNGVGQDAEGLAEAWSLGKPNDKKNSRFGVGLKQSSLSIGSVVTLISKKKGEEEIHSLEIDKDNIKPSQLLSDINIKNVPISETEFKKEDHFFEVVIEKLNRKYTKSVINETRRLLSIYFGSYIRNKEMVIVFQKEKIRPHPEPKLIFKQKIENKSLGLSGWWGITVRGEGSTKVLGPDTFYNGRLITQGDLQITGESSHPMYARLKGKIYFDSPTVFDENLTSSKNSWIKNQNYYDVQKWLENNLRLPFYRKLVQIQKEDKETEAHKKTQNASYVISKIMRDKFPELRKDTLSKTRATSNDEIFGESIFDVEKRDGNSSGEGSGEDSRFNDIRKPKETHKRGRPHGYITISGIRYKIIIRLISYLDETQPRYAFVLDKEKKVLEMDINKNNPYIDYLLEQNLDIYLIEVGQFAIEAILKEVSKENDVEKFIKRREETISDIDWIGYLNENDRITKDEELEKTTIEIFDKIDEDKRRLSDHN